MSAPMVTRVARALAGTAQSFTRSRPALTLPTRGGTVARNGGGTVGGSPPRSRRSWTQ